MRIFSILIAVVFFIACKNQKSAEYNNDTNYNNIAEGISNNQAKLYSLPSPYQVSTFLQILDIKYNFPLIENNVNCTKQYSSPISKCLNLGINFVDIYYSYTYEKFAESYTMLSRIEDLMHELGLKSKKDYDLLNRIEKNFHKKDSLDSFIKLYQKDFEDYYEITDQKQLTFVIVAGIYIEGLYLISNIYEDAFRNKALTNFIDLSFKKVIFQQAIFLENLIELIDSYDDSKLHKLSDTLKEFQKLFNSAKLSYKILDNKNIDSVNFNKKYLKILKAKVSEVRNNIIEDKF